MPQRPPRHPRLLPVLLLGDHGVEYLSAVDSGGSYARAEAPAEVLPDGALREGAQLAAELVRGLGEAPGPCVLALGASVLRQRMLSLPVDATRDLRGILHRKAAALLEAPLAETLYSALPLELEEGARERRWLLFALRRSGYLALRYALREQGFTVQRVVSERMALAASAKPAEEAGDNQACVAVGMESAATGVHLLNGDELVQQSILTVRFDSEAEMAKMIIQELRGFDAFWRRRSRGGAIGTVVLGGFGPQWAQRLEFAVRAALPNTKVTRLVSDGDESNDRRSARMAALASCRTHSPLQISVNLPLAPRRRTVALVAGASALIAALGAFVTIEGAGAHRERLNAEREELSVRAAGLDGLLARRERIRTALDSLARQRARAEYVGSHGVPLEATLREALGIIGDDGALLELAVRSDGDDAGRVHVGGVVPSAPLAAQSALEGMLARAAEAETLVGFDIETPREAGRRGPTLRFSAEAWLGGGR